MKNVKQLLFLVFMMFLCISVAAADEKGGQAATPGPTVASQTMSITVGGGEYDLIIRIMDFAAGAWTPTHIHGGNGLATVLSGEMTRREKGTEKIFKAGESWTEPLGDVHAVGNAGAAPARVVAVFLLPKGAELTTNMK